MFFQCNSDEHDVAIGKNIYSQAFYGRLQSNNTLLVYIHHVGYLPNHYVYNIGLSLLCWHDFENNRLQIWQQ